MGCRTLLLQAMVNDAGKSNGPAHAIRIEDQAVITPFTFRCSEEKLPTHLNLRHHFLERSTVDDGKDVVHVLPDVHVVGIVPAIQRSSVHPPRDATVELV